MIKKAKQQTGSIQGRVIAIDSEAPSAHPDLPAFLAPPEGAPIYYGFPVLDDVEVEGFKLGKISEFETEPPIDYGDAFVVAPDGSRAGLVWEVSDQDYVREICPVEAGRWGVWAVSFPHPIRTREDARRNLQAILPGLKEKWELWRRQY